MSHGNVTVSGRRVTILSYQLRVEGIVEIKQGSRKLPLVLEAVESPEREVPEYIRVDLDKMQATFVRAPKIADVPYPVQIEPNLVIEFYSR